jgi:hypothetical protein
VPKTVKEALALDCKNGNILWADAIAKEMKEVRVRLPLEVYYWELENSHVGPLLLL